MSFFKEIADTLGYDEAKLALGYSYVNYNGEAVYVEGVKQILRIGESEMVFRLPRGVLRVAGKDLAAEEVCGATVLVRGRVSAVYTEGVWQDGQKESGA